MISKRSGSLVGSLIPVVVCLVTSSAFGGLLTNPGFDTPTPGLTPPTYTTSITGASGPGSAGGVASADGWFLYNNTDVTTTSELLLSTDPNGGGHMISISTGGPYNGLYQRFPTVSATTASVDVYVLSGIVEFMLWDNGGNTRFASVLSTTHNQWETLTLDVTSGNPGELVLYSPFTSPAGASFYADNARVPIGASVPEPSTLWLSLVGAGAALIAVRCRRRARR
jgi:hypothetical protein